MIDNKIKKAGGWASIAGSLGLAGFQTYSASDLNSQLHAAHVTIREQATSYAEQHLTTIRGFNEDLERCYQQC